MLLKKHGQGCAGDERRIEQDAAMICIGTSSA
jgi:hypothetical protein